MSETPEQRARREIDADLTAAGWILQNKEDLDLTAGRGIAVRNFTMKPGFGFADYLLYLDRKAAGAVEAKPEGTLTGVEAQSAKYAAGLLENLPAHRRPLPFTIQRLYSMLKGETEFDAGNEEGSAFDTAKPWQGEPPDVVYNAGIPPEFFDFIVVDECHRSIYELWSQVLLYFDSFIIGLTATSAGKTIGFFNQNLVMQYGHDEAVTDGINVDFDVYRIRTRVTEQGATILAGDTGIYVDKRATSSRGASGWSFSIRT